MRVYEIGIATNGQRLVFATCDTAREALVRFQAARQQYHRAWVTDGERRRSGLADAWYLAECHSDWKHSYRVRIDTFDKPGGH
jgi:hypothetical protein